MLTLYLIVSVDGAVKAPEPILLKGKGSTSPRILQWTYPCQGCQTLVEMPHAGDNNEQTCRISTNTLQLFSPKLVYSNVDNSLRLLFGSKLTGSDWTGATCADPDPQTNVRNHDIWYTEYQGAAWSSPVNLTNTPNACETWPDAPSYIYTNKLPVLYYEDPQCGSSLFGEGAAVYSPWKVNFYNLPNYNLISSDVAGQSNYDYARNASYTWILQDNDGDVHVAYMWRDPSAGNVRREYYNYYDEAGAGWLDPVGFDIGLGDGNGFGNITLRSIDPANWAAAISAHVPPSLEAKVGIDDSEGQAAFTVSNLPNTLGGNCRSPYIYAIDATTWLLWCVNDGATADNYVLFRTADGGATWTNEGDLPRATDNGFLERGIITSRGNLVAWVYVGHIDATNNDAGLYYVYSTDGGATWSAPQTILQEQAVRDIQADPLTEANPYCFIWVTRPSAVIDNQNRLHVAWEEFCLDGTTNPAGDTLLSYSRIQYWISNSLNISEKSTSFTYKFDAKSKKLEFNLPTGSHYELRIYNASGALVRTYKLNNNYVYLKDLNKGVYFFNIGNTKGKIVIQ